MDFLQNYALENFPLEEYGGDGILTLASCNGLICLVYDSDDVVLWNMVTKDYHIIERPICRGWYDGWSFGFGYDSINDNYKVVRLECIQGRHSPCALHKSKFIALDMMLGMTQKNTAQRNSKVL
ncbi:hypothetical protein SLA2020_140030 [Shorea laevis]